MRVFIFLASRRGLRVGILPLLGLLALAFFSSHAAAQMNWSTFFKVNPVENERFLPHADAEDDLATGAPLTIRPSDEMLRNAPVVFAAPLPPRKPVPPFSGQSNAGTAGPEKSQETKTQDAKPLDPPLTPELAAEDGVTAPEEPASPPELGPSVSTFQRFFSPTSPDSGSPSGPQQQAALTMPSLPQTSTSEEIEAEEEKAPEPMLVEKQTDYVNISCLTPELMKVVRKAGEHFKGTPVITSGQRTNGRRGSYHRKCMAADFFIAGVERATLAKYLRTLPDAGGVGTYCHTKSVHVDTGEPRNWFQCGMRFRFAQR